MAKVENVQLSITGEKVEVKGRLRFKPSEVGKKFRMQVHLIGEDWQIDDEPNEAGFNDVIHTFLFGSGPFFAQDKEVKAEPVVNVKVENKVAGNKLNEDRGLHLEGTPSSGQHPAPNRDEIFAQIRLSTLDNPATIARGRSDTISGNFH